MKRRFRAVSESRIYERLSWSPHYLDFFVLVEVPARVGTRVRRCVLKALREEFRHERQAEERRMKANARLRAREDAAIRRVRGLLPRTRRARR